MLLETLKLQSGLTTQALARLERTASARYKVYHIPKRDGTLRKIEHPSRELKALQRWLNVFLLQALPQHPNATAYSQGASIKGNAARHLGTQFTVRLDFKEFFPSFKETGIRKFLLNASERLGLQLTERDIRFACKVFCRNGALTIGAPTSPSLSNRMMYEFDRSVTAFAEGAGLVYTRYADDIFISSYHPNNLDGVAAAVRECIASYPYARLKLNHPKTTYLSRRYKREITGIIITPENRISVGRKSKRRIKGLVWRMGQGTLSAEEKSYLAGYLAFVKDVEPTFVESLVRKYGTKLMDAAKSGVILQQSQD